MVTMQEELRATIEINDILMPMTRLWQASADGSAVSALVPALSIQPTYGRMI
jgi:hypothetical protein